MRASFGIVAGLALLTACTDPDPVLPGDREEVRPGRGPGVVAAASEAPGSAPISLPAARNLADWPMRVGTATNDPAHASLREAPVLAWSADIGQGDTRRQKITADPVSDGTRVFALDARSTVSATAVGGGTVWSRNLVPGTDRATDASGGGLAVVGGTLYVTTGFGELHALDAATGQERWVQRLDAPLTTPKAVDGLVYVVSRDSRAWAIDADQGRIQWELPSAPAASVTATAPAPAIDGRLVVFPFGSGEIVAALRRTGVRVWGSSVSGRRLGVAYSGVGDITGDPVLSGGLAYAGTTAGRIVALNVNSGERVWTAREGAVSPMVVKGGAVFAVTDRAQLVRLDAATGDVVWRADLPFYKARRLGRREGVFVHYGPILAGGRLWVASSDGGLRAFDPVSGALTAAADVPGGAASRPIVVGGTMYVVGRRGQLHAFR
ncbi:PQQ-like beta-propeller repeat protein [Jannaschia aquimarina]|uniref:BamB protein n=1 Tax=Jannaschia aquimarina TaxID=935700 RepID=A0A0D1ECN9_9RHOB|nr:PQQ-like beta-propeller repeat protein [Jannaschia aquimarina]KIT14696.1 Outer membrane protein assembly factor BamB precursor [Jannaschia aquimarina]SNT38276.1 Outer membrane protein assembly factor BamB, contains PQQ-like beta-propeller repeat [Jannaschia aquimarina]